jgi:lactate dehydrogenase-like 2-hydroxyacid dehydrogenase
MSKKFTFNRITIIGIAELPNSILNLLQDLSQAEVIVFEKIEDANETIIHQTDCLLVSIRVKINASVLTVTKKLRYIGVYGSSLNNIDLDIANQLGICVSKVVGYCVRETAEFIIFAVGALVRGLLRHDWPKIPYSLYGKTLGIVGMGNVGMSLSRLAISMGMQVLYYSKTRKPTLENHLLKYADLQQLLSQSDVISLHVPPHVRALTTEDFSYLRRRQAILVNTCIGRVFDEQDLIKWLSYSENNVIFDALADQSYSNVFFQSNVIRCKPSAYATLESISTKQEKFIKNVSDFIENVVSSPQ